MNSSSPANDGSSCAKCGRNGSLSNRVPTRAMRLRLGTIARAAVTTLRSDNRNVVPVTSGGRLNRASVSRVDKGKNHRHRWPQLGAQAHEDFERLEPWTTTTPIGLSRYFSRKKVRSSSHTAGC